MFIFIEIAFTKEYTIKYEVQDEEQEEYIEINYVANDAELHKNIIFNDFLRSSTYDAFFICDNGDEKTKYKIWDASKSEWSTVEQYSIAYAENETLGFKDYKAERLQAILISHIKSLNNSLSNLNVGYEGEDNHLLELGFLQINNEKSLIKNEGTTIDNLQIYNSESGIFIFNVEYPDGENSFCKCIKFRDGNSILELKKKLNEKKSDDDCFKYFISYMDESKRNSLNDVEKAIGKEIARSIYMSLYATHAKSNGVLNIDGDMNILLNLYDSQDNYFVKEYLKLCYEEKLPVFATIYNAYQNDYKPRANEFIDGKLFAKYALTYLFSGPEYNSSFEFNHDSVLNKIYNKYSKDGYEKYFSEFFPNLTLESIHNKDRSIKKYMAYPIPYVKSGIDTPRTFWKKMSTQETGKFVKTTYNKAYNPNRYKPGESAGTDSWGMISGILSEMSLSNDFKYFSKSGLLSLKDYSEYLGEITENSIINNSTLSEYRIDSSRLKEMSVIVPEFSKISVGDIIEYEYSNNEKNVAVVVGFSNTGSVSSKSDVLIVQLDSESKQAVLKTWAELKPDNSVVRRLFKYGASDTYNCSYWDVFDSKIIEKDISIETMKELTQKSTEKYRWMPNTGEYLVLKKIKLNAYNKAGISINDNLGKVRLIGAKDRNFTNNNTQAGLANIYNNKA
ncbi:MAG: hypothetical protein MJ232_08610, partial [archaeon]|nr:hypothetical protein [archaeon]